METPLHQDPDAGAPLIALLAEGAVVSIDGPPVDGFYPVSAGNLVGWMRGETLSLQKDIVDESAPVDATPDGVPDDGVAAAEQEWIDPAQLPQDATTDPAAPPADASVDPAAPVDPATAPVAAPIDPAAVPDAVPEAVPTDASAPTDPAADTGVTHAPVDPNTGEPVPAATDPSVTDPTTTDPAVVDPAAGTTPADPALAAAELEPSPASQPEPDPTENPVPTPDPNVTPIPVPDAGPTGPASVAADLPILLGPGADYGLISTAPLGSTIEQTGHVIDGYVSVQFNGITGWAALDLLAEPGTIVPDPATEPEPEPEQERNRNDSTTPTPDAPATPAAESAKDKPDPAGKPEPSATAIPTPTPVPAPIGPASVMVDAPIFSGPGPDFGLVFTVPQGSTLEQTGQLENGYVSVQYKEVVGWAAADQLSEPIDFVEETPEEDADPVDTKTPRPGSGVAYTTVDLSLRAGPSADEEPVVVVPAGSRVVLTGVMEGNFQRVTYREDIGWIANDYLATPEDPAPNPEAKGKNHYSERQITRIIYDAADRYGQSRKDMLRVAKCESNLDPYAVNPSGSYGLFQFIRSTWKSTPFGDEDIFDPRANANAAAWMWSEGRKSEWVCQ